MVLWNSPICSGSSSVKRCATVDDFFALVHPDDRSGFATAVAEALRTKRDYEITFRYRHSSGEYRWMTRRGRGLYDDGGELIEVAGVGIDITEQQHTREVAHDRASLLRQIGDNLPDGALYQVRGGCRGRPPFRLLERRHRVS